MKRKVGIAVVGCGRIGGTHISAIRECNDKAVLSAVVIRDEARAKKVAEDFNTKYYTSVGSALEDAEIDALVVCLPHDQHYGVAMEAMKAGKHVLVEKPLATSSTEGSEMITFSREKGLVLMAGMSMRHVAAMQELKKRMEAEIGNPFNFLYTFASFSTEDTRPLWWRSEAKTGGLTFTLVGPHTIDTTLWLFENKKPIRVYAEAQSVNPVFEGCGEVTLLLKFDDGAMATNYLSIHTKPMRWDGTIVGPKGSAYFVHTGAFDGLFGVPSTDLYINGELIMSGTRPQPNNFLVQMREFASAILENREPWVKLDQVLMGLRIIEAARTSFENSRPVDI